MKLLFPQNPMMKKLPDSIFEHEFDAAQSLGFACLLFAEETLSQQGAEQAVRHLPDGDGEPLLYRGWIWTESVYRQFHHALMARGYRLVSTPEQYAQVTYFPNYYPKVREASPVAVWTDTADPYLAWSRSRKLGDGPFVLKDHIKSAKHKWHEACFVPKGAGREQFESVAEALRKEQGTSFNRGFVVKQYVPLRSRGFGPREYPMCEEYRLFFWHGKLLISSHYHNQSANRIDWNPFEGLAGRFDAPFFTMDVAQTEDGDWLIVDMGAGECSSLPPSLPADKFYNRLRDVLNTTAQSNVGA
ncbi:ATP-grasp domain-containing protein [Zavarzinella formosa]|uniref:ATP-grasp domain-containing protein n=1 Tax=Zavarzinella formosa TaxID=360055 RepID=UPI0002E8E335|nr:ATP-grasp domain-containing protein [Zavarzinella formosa]